MKITEIQFNMKYLLIFCIAVIGFPSSAQEFSLPKGHQIISEVIGDLNADQIDEKVIVVETDEETDFGFVRNVYVLKSVNDTWKIWKKSQNAILKSQEGGMMGDPFEEIKIIKGILIINQSGGSSWKWNRTDKYRYQNGEFELIGYSSHSGKLCEYWTSFDFNLSTGQIDYKKEFEDCENNQEIYKTEKESFYKKGIQLNLKNRNLKEVKIQTPTYNAELYL